MSKKIHTELPDNLLAWLRGGAPAVVMSTGADGYPTTAFTWAAAPDAKCIRFGVDDGSSSLDNIRRSGQAALQVLGPNNLAFLVKGTARRIKDRVAAAAPAPMMLFEMQVVGAKDQAWPGVTVSPLAFEWPADKRAALEKMEQAVFAEMRDWKP
jgi:hypothetical protein